MNDPASMCTPNSVKGLRIPRYRLHRASGQAVVTIRARDIYLGTFGSEQSRAEYDRIIAEYIAASGVPEDRRATLGINEFCLAYWRHAQAYYPGATASGTIKPVIRRFRKIYGSTRVADFGPLKLNTSPTQSAALPSEAPPPQVGTVIDGCWRLESLVRRGRFAEVWRACATDTTSPAQAAIKFLRCPATAAATDWSLDEAARRFENEQHCLRSLAGHGASTCQLIASTGNPNQHHFLMRWEEGTALDLFALRHSLSLGGRLALLLRVLETLGHIHELGIAHRDIKPANILVRLDAHGEPEPVLIDFGAATTEPHEHVPQQLLADARTASLRASAYTPPEQLAPRRHRLDWCTADIYRFGLLMHEIMLGFRPWQWLEPSRFSSPLEVRRARARGLSNWKQRNFRLFSHIPQPLRHACGPDRLRRREVASLASARQITRLQYLSLLASQPLCQLLRQILAPHPDDRPTVSSLHSSLVALRAAYPRPASHD
jgi:serine/threonine protein kinase